VSLVMHADMRPTYLLADLDRAAAPRREQDLVTRAHVHRDNFAVLSWRTWASGNHRGLRERRRGRRRGQEDARRSLGLGLETLDEHAVKQRNNRGNRADSSRRLTC